MRDFKISFALGVLLVGISGWFVAVILSVVTGGAFRVVANIFGYMGVIGFVWTICALIFKLVKKR